MMFQSLLNGAIQGSLLGVLGIAFSLVYASTSVFHIALGAIYSATPYLLMSGMRQSMPWPLAAALSLVIVALLGLAAEEFVHWPLERKNAPSDVHFIASLGAFLVLAQLVELAWGPDARALTYDLDEVWRSPYLTLTSGQAICASVGVLGSAGVAAWLRWTDHGLRFRAMAREPTLLATLGTDVRRVRRVVFALSSVLAGIVSLANARDGGFDPHTGMRAVLVGVTATILGGRGSFSGVLIAGLMLGVLRSLVAWQFSARWEEAATFAVLALILVVAPAGLPGLRSDLRVRPEDLA